MALHPQFTTGKDMLRWSFGKNYGFLFDPRDDTERGAGYYNTDPLVYARPYSALLSYEEGDWAYYDKAVYNLDDTAFESGNIDWTDGDEEQISWDGPAHRYLGTALSAQNPPDAQRWVTGQEYNLERQLVDFDLAEINAYEGNSYETTWERYQLGVFSSVYFRNGRQVASAGFQVAIGAAIRIEGGIKYFVEATYQISSGSFDIYESEIDEENVKTNTTQVGTTTLSITSLDQPVFFNKSATECVTIMTIDDGGPEHRPNVIQGVRDKGTGLWTISILKACRDYEDDPGYMYRADFLSQTGTPVIIFSAEFENPPGVPDYRIDTFQYNWTYEAHNTYNTEVIFAVDYKNDRYVEASASYDLQINTDVMATAFAERIFEYPENEYGGYLRIGTPSGYASSYTYSQTRSSSQSVSISGGQSATINLGTQSNSFSYSTEVTGTGTPSNDAEHVSGLTGSYTSSMAALMYLDLRYLHYVKRQEAESGSDLSSGDPVQVTTTINKSIDWDVFLFGSNEGGDSYSLPVDVVTSDISGPTVSLPVNNTVTQEFLSPIEAQWIGNGNWANIATLADQRTAFANIALGYPQADSNLPANIYWSYLQPATRNWFQKAVGPFRPSLSSVDNDAGISGTGKHYGSVRPLMVFGPKDYIDPGL